MTAVNVVESDLVSLGVASAMLKKQWFQARRLLSLGELGEVVLIGKRYFVHGAAVEAYLAREALKAKAQAVAEAYIASETLP